MTRTHPSFSASIAAPCSRAGRGAGRRSAALLPAAGASRRAIRSVIEAAKKEGAVSLYTLGLDRPVERHRRGLQEEVRHQRARCTAPDRPTSPRGCSRRSRRDARRPTRSSSRSRRSACWCPTSPPTTRPSAPPSTPPTRRRSHTLIRMYMAQIGWNTNAVKAGAPTDWKDLLDPKWKGRFGSLDPHVTATTLAWQVMVERAVRAELPAGVRRQQAQALRQHQRHVAGDRLGRDRPRHHQLLRRHPDGRHRRADGRRDPEAHGALRRQHRGLRQGAASERRAPVLRLRLLGGGPDASSTSPARRSRRIRRRSAPKAGSLAELGKIHAFSQPDYKKIVADTPKLLAEWDKHVK